MPPVTSVDEYIVSFPPEMRTILVSLREVARTALPDAEETISYGIPAFRVAGTDVVYFAAWRHHVSLYPVPDVRGDLANDILRYRSGKGTLRFPLNEPLPMELIERVIESLGAQRRPR